MNAGIPNPFQNEDRGWEPHDHGVAQWWEAWVVTICIALASAAAFYAIVRWAP